MSGKRERVEGLDQVCSEEKPNEEVISLSPGGLKLFQLARSFNALDALEWRRPIVGNVMEALADPNTHLIGVYGSDDHIKDALLQIVNRRIEREAMFDLVLTATVPRRLPDTKKIQEEIARHLGLIFNHKSKEERAQELIERIMNVQKILVGLRDLHMGFDLRKIGIPYGSDHTGCKILLTSTTEDVLTNRMRTQKTFQC